jgi:methylthioribose-1-phosphate isomerase
MPPPDPDETVRLARRRFFKAFVSDAMRTAANVAGVAGALQRTSAEMAGALLGGAAAEPATPPAPAPAAAGDLTIAGVTPGGSVPALAPAAGSQAAGFRSPFRLEDNGIVLLDQRRLPDEIVEVTCRSAADVRVAILEGVVRGAPILGQVAASAIALAAAQAAGSMPYARRAILHGTSNALRVASGPAAPVRHAIDRMNAVIMRRTDLFDDGPGLAEALRAEADAIVSEATTDHAALGGHGARLFESAPAGAEPLRVLTIGSVGALAGGQLGTVLAVLNRALADGCAIEVTVCETRPSLAGTRLTGWELSLAGVPYTIIPDVAAGALLASSEIDVVMVGADSIAANGDTLADAGTLALALLAARFEVPFIVVAAGVTIDAETAEGRGFIIEPRPAHEVLSFGGRSVAPAGAVARHPGLDLTPVALVGAIVTEAGMIEPPLAGRLAEVAAAVQLRWNGPAAELAPEPEAAAAAEPDEAAGPGAAELAPEPETAPAAEPGSPGGEDA